MNGEIQFINGHGSFFRGGAVPQFSSRRGCDFSPLRGAREAPKLRDFSCANVDNY